MDKKHARYLRELGGKGLCLMRLKGSGTHDVTFVVRKHVPYGISYDFIKDDMEVTTFLDRDEDNPAECYFYKSSCLVPVVELDEDEYEEKLRREDEKLKQCAELVTKKV